MTTRGSLPELTDVGLLPAGVHDATLHELQAAFGQFQQTDRRVTLFSRLQRYIAEVRLAGWGAKVIVDGSFVMAGIDDPGDVDLILVLPIDWDVAAELRPFEYNLISKTRVRKTYGFDVFPVRDGSADYNTWVDFFQQVRPEHRAALGLPQGIRKGLVRISP